MPIVDMSIPEAKKLFDCNVWGHLALTQAFMPRLLASPKAMVVNHTSVGVHAALPFQAAYNASKAAMCMFSDILRLELQPFDIEVVNLKTAGVKTNIVQNIQARQPQLPASSIFAAAKELVESALRSEWVGDRGITAEEWAKGVVADLQKSSVPPVIWRGESAWMARFASILPFGWIDGTYKRMTGLEKIEQTIRAS
jgi:NAD(P)-dependent dehydrogenase (short-subunit alcohol dehydrogenase family)